jgi:hypothetical protein
MNAPGENLRIDGARLWDSIMDMAKIGPEVAGGQRPSSRCRRPSSSPEAQTDELIGTLGGVLKGLA